MFDTKQQEILKEPLNLEHIKTRDGTGDTKLSYLASHHVIDEANRIFGFGMWGTEIQILKQIDRTEYEKPAYKQGDKPKQMISISYICQLKLTVNGADGAISHEDTGFGNGVAGNTPYGLGSCIELASKEAVTDALKRCFRYYGNKFGNSLYDKDGHGAMTEEAIELNKTVTDEQWAEINLMMEARSIDNDWLLVAMKSENYGYETLEEMPQAWYPTAYKLVYEHGLTAIKKKEYDTQINKRLELIDEAASIKMLRIVYGEAVKLAKEQDDKKMLLQLEHLKNEQKEKLEKKEAKK